MEEIWKNINIEDYNKYQVSSLGRIKNKNKEISEKEKYENIKGIINSKLRK